MIEALNAILPIIIYLLLIVLLGVVIVLGIKIIIAIDKVNALINDVQEKVATLNSLFKLAQTTADRFSSLTGGLIDTLLSAINKVLGIRNGKDEEEDYE